MLMKGDDQVVLRRQEVGLDYVLSPPVAEGLLHPTAVANPDAQP
jgi:hypothetical protein